MVIPCQTSIRTPQAPQLSDTSKCRLIVVSAELMMPLSSCAMKTPTANSSSDQKCEVCGLPKPAHPFHSMMKKPVPDCVIPM